jgi:PAS domain S-box-containing protein
MASQPTSPAPGMDPPRQPSAQEVLDLLERTQRDHAVFMLDLAGRVDQWTPGAEHVTGYPAEEIIGRHLRTFYPAEDLVLGGPEQALQYVTARGSAQDEGWRIRRDGSRFWADQVITLLTDDEGRQRGYGCVIRDLTERRRTEQEVRESEERFRLLVQDVVDYAIFMLDATGHVVSWNAGAERIKGYDAQEIRGRHFSVFYPPEDIAAGRPEHNLETAVREGRVEDEGWRVRKDGTRFWGNVVITALYDEHRRLRGFGKVTRDMTERRDAQRDLSDRRRLLAHLVQAQEVERRRIAWEVHDDAIQVMAAIALRQQALGQQLPEPYAQQLTDLGWQVDEAIDRLRALVTWLRPPGIDRQPLAAALGDYLAEHAVGWALKYRVDNRLAAEPFPETAVTVFRIAQEALANVHKHAGAENVEIVLSTRDGGVLTQIADDGVGISGPAALEPGPEHFGVIEMRERAETVGGWWTMRRRAERGTVVEFWIPSLSPAPGRRS